MLDTAKISEYKIKKIVAVLEDGQILPPCGGCREFIYQIDGDNLETEVIIGENKVVKLREFYSRIHGMKT